MSNQSVLEIVKSYHKSSYQYLKEALELDESKDPGKKAEAKLWYEKGVNELVCGIQVSHAGVTPHDKVKINEWQTKMKKILNDTNNRLEDLEAEINGNVTQRKSRPKPAENIAKKPLYKPKPTLSHTKKPWNSGTKSSTTSRPTSSKCPQTAANKTKDERGSSDTHKALIKMIPKEMLDKILDTIVEPSANKVSFKDIVGQEAAKKALQEIVILPALRPDVFSGLREPAKGLLLFGPPGNGKTLLAKAVANEANARFFNISAATLTSKWVGESEKLVRALFAAARHLQPSIIFIDEIDSLLRTRQQSENDSTRRLLNEFLLQFDGVSTTESSDDRLLVMGATNRPEELDVASIRRFPKRLYVRLPDEDARACLLISLVTKHECALSTQEIRSLARACQHYSFNDLTNLAKDAAFGPIRELSGDQLKTIDKNKIRKINLGDFHRSLRQVRSSVPPETLRMYEEWNRKYGDTSDL